MTDLFIDRDYADAFIGEDTVTALFTDPSDGATFSTTKFNAVVEAASMAARSALKAVGYTVSGTNITSVFVKLSTLHHFVPMAYARRQQAVPDDLMALIGGMLDDIRSGELPDPDSSPATTGAVGGHTWTEYTAGVSGAVINPLKGLRGYMG